MKTLPQSIADQLTHQAIEPTFLIEIELDEKLYLSTRDAFEWDRVNYVTGLVQKLQINQSTATFGLVNDSFKYTTPALSGVYHRAQVKIWWATGLAPFSPYVEYGYYAESYSPYDSREAPLLLFEGNISQFTQITSVLGVVATRSAARRFPTLRVLPPIANFVAAEGTIVTFNDLSYRLEPRNR